VLSGRARLRPVLMTSLAAALGMLPLALGVGTGAQMLKPLAVAVMGGLAISVVLALLATPTAYYTLTPLGQGFGASGQRCIGFTRAGETMNTCKSLLNRIVLVGAILAIATAFVAAEDQALTLGECLELARQHNPTVLAARAGHAVGEADVRLAGQRPNPEFSLDYTRSTPHPSILVSESFPLGGKRARAIDVARGEMGSTDLAIESVERDIRRDVRLDYYGLLRALRTEAIGREVASRAAKLAETSQVRFEQGDVPELEVKQARLVQLRAEAAQKARSGDVAVARQRLDADLGRPPGAPPLKLATSLELAEPVPEIGELLGRATSAGLEARALGAREVTEKARLGLAGAQRWPDLTAGAGVELNDPEFDVGMQGTLGLTLPLFAHGSAEAARARAALEQLRLERQALSRRVAADLAMAAARVDKAREQVKLYATGLVPGADEVAALYGEGYKEGTVDLVTVLAAERGAREVHTEYADALFELHAAVAELERAAGVNLMEGAGHD